MMIKTDLKVLNEILKGERKEICSIYGEPASGKTTLVKETAIYRAKKGEKVIFIDSENSFSVERILQLSNDDKSVLDNIFVLKPKDLKSQGAYIKSILKSKGISMLVIDSIGIFYRLEAKNDSKEANREIDRQFNYLSELCQKKVSVLLTNQVYRNIDTGEINVVVGNMFSNWSKFLIRLEKDPVRKLILEKSENKEVEFKIENTGLSEI